MAKLCFPHGEEESRETLPGGFIRVKIYCYAEGSDDIGSTAWALLDPAGIPLFSTGIDRWNKKVEAGRWVERPLFQRLSEESLTHPGSPEFERILGEWDEEKKREDRLRRWERQVAQLTNQESYWLGASSKATEQGFSAVAESIEATILPTIIHEKNKLMDAKPE